jgi:hypothetical protein
MRLRSILISACAATALLAIPVSSQAASSQAAAVRAVADKYITAAYSGNGAVLCPLLTVAAQQEVAKTAKSTSCLVAEAAEDKTLAKTLAAETKTEQADYKKLEPALAQLAVEQINKAPIVISGSTATLEFTKLKGSLHGKNNMVLLFQGGHWLISS